jgi:hypothetical protein
MEEITFEISNKDIDQGRRSDCYACPAALSLSRLLDSKVINDVVIGVNSSCINNEYYSHGEDLVEFILNFDNGKKVTPSKFTITKRSYPSKLRIVTN